LASSGFLIVQYFVNQGKLMSVKFGKGSGGIRAGQGGYPVKAELASLEVKLATLLVDIGDARHKGKRPLKRPPPLLRLGA
jgi:hypothetical protein